MCDYPMQKGGKKGEPLKKLKCCYLQEIVKAYSRKAKRMGWS